MPILRMLCAILFAVGYPGSMEAQEPPVPQLSPGSEHKPASASRLQTTPSSTQSIALSVPRGTPLQVALDQEIRVKGVGQPVHARIVEPVYAFDRLVVPVGSQVTGQVTVLRVIGYADPQTGTCCSLTRRSSCAFAATIIVERLIATAPMLMGRSSLHRTKNLLRPAWRRGYRRSPIPEFAPSFGRSHEMVRSLLRRRGDR